MAINYLIKSTSIHSADSHFDIFTKIDKVEHLENIFVIGSMLYVQLNGLVRG